MSQYYIDTASGPAGPYSAERIVDGVRQGKIPTAAMIRDAVTGQTLRAVDLAGGGQSPTASGSSPGVNPGSLGASPQYRPRPQAQPQYYGQHQQQYPQQQYGQAQQYQPYPQQYGQQYPQQYGAGYPGQYPSAGAYQPYGSNQTGMPYVTGETSSLAIASLVCSLVSLVVCAPLCIVGIVLGVMALKECHPNGPKQGRGMALGGIWSGVGILVLCGFFVMLLIAADSL